MTDVRIYQPSKTAMQSGKRKTKKWLMEFNTQRYFLIDPFMGWISSANTSGQLRLFFTDLQDAIQFAKQKGLSYTINSPTRILKKPKNYAANFTCSRIRGA